MTTSAEFHKVTQVIRRLADQGKFKRRQQTTYDKLFEGIDEGTEYVAELAGRKYIIEEYASDPEPMDIIQARIIYYNLSVESKGKKKEMVEDDTEEQREELFKYVAERSKALRIVKAHKHILDRFRIK